MAPNAAICLDPFHAVAIAAIAAKALDTTRREQWARVRKVDPDAAKTLKGTRFVLLKNPENHSYTQTVHMAAIKRSGEWIWRTPHLPKLFDSMSSFFANSVNRLVSSSVVAPPSHIS